ncbi:glycoside hydrolase family 79 protein [Rhizoctonia solani AG-1 IB]|uniref:Glycoside hydrolase family 79 protein n=1 Tax=Thanatephorus cucumeris (strain AG1-IB / isolate 7/3/14) TaxID=1108050 RepID=M5BJ62_THACB|nr:glycoside hydrolase family 79 protein [Rhizoctonia solani AG-1 IB]
MELSCNWTSTLTKALNLPPGIFQANGFAEDPTSSAPMTTVSTINDGIDKTGVIKLFDQHTYQYSTCDPARNAKATLEALVNHNNITAYIDLWKPQIAAARGVGKEFVIGE